MSKYSKIGTIIKHEYIAKVKTKGFLIGTILGPLGLVALVGIIFYIGSSMGETSKKLAVVDETEFIGDILIERDTSLYYTTDKSVDELSESLQNEEIDGYIVIPEDILDSGKASVFTSGGGGLGLVTSLEKNLTRIIRTERLKDIGTTSEQIDKITSSVKIHTKKITEEGKTEKDDTEIMAFIGYGLGFVMYMLVFIYGNFVSRGVIEEKTNRIIEILASSAKPFEIMMGKVIGIGFVGLTQVIFWLILGAGLLAILGPILASNPENLKEMTEMANQQSGGGMPEAGNFVIPGISFGLILGFLFYFIAGYFTYATLFAGIGAAVDNEQDAAQMQIPVTLPIIFAIIVVPQVMSNPDSLLSVILSIFPLTSPIIMIVRIAATNVPLWELAASVIVLFANFYLSIWISAKIYRIGILMTGKKPNFKDLIKWVREA